MFDRKLFFPNDLDRINNKYFNKIREEEIEFLDPSYWFENYSLAAIRAGFDNVKNYTSDYHKGLKNEKPIILDALSGWDSIKYDYDDITMCSSATGASNTLLAYIKNVLKIDKIYFETPCYFASLKQAEFLGFDFTMLPTYFPDFKIDLNQLITKSPKVVWITQPRFGLGSNYEVEFLKNILQVIGNEDFLVIDEAAEGSFPSHLASFNFKHDQRIIKIRSPFKGVGINGPRVSMILHGISHRQQMQNTLEQVQGSMDVFSLRFAKEIFEKEDLFRGLVLAANKQVVDSYMKLKTLTLGTALELSKMEAGYIGSISVKYNDNRIGYAKKRETLLRYCASNKMPVILGSTMHFAKDNNREYIRISYFNRMNQLFRSIETLAKFAI